MALSAAKGQHARVENQQSSIKTAPNRESARAQHVRGLRRHGPAFAQPETAERGDKRSRRRDGSDHHVIRDPDNGVVSRADTSVASLTAISQRDHAGISLCERLCLRITVRIHWGSFLRLGFDVSTGVALDGALVRNATNMGTLDRRSRKRVPLPWTVAANRAYDVCADVRAIKRSRRSREDGDSALGAPGASITSGQTCPHNIQ